MEEYVYILDYLLLGSSGFGKRESVCYAVGEEEFKLFELIPKISAHIIIGDRTFVGKDSPTQKRDVIDHIKRRISYSDLTSNACIELEYAITNIVMSDNKRFIRFFNESGPISMRKHMLEELPGLGKKSMSIILEERKKGDFKDFSDLTNRTGIKNPEKLIVARICLEIKDPYRKRYIFVSK